MLICWILAILEADPSFDFWAPRMMEVDDADERSKRSRGGQSRHITFIRNVWKLGKVEWEPCARLASCKSAGGGGVGGDDGSTALWN